MVTSERSSTRSHRFIQYSTLVVLTIVVTTVVCITTLLPIARPARAVTDHVITSPSLEAVNNTFLSTLSTTVEQLKHDMSKLASSNMATRLEKGQPPTFALPPDEAALHAKKLAINYTQIWMSAMEVNLALRYLADRATYLEWGSGGSTMNFAKFATTRAVSIEHDVAWCDRMRDNLQADDALSHVDYHCVPVKKGTLGWGVTPGFGEGTYSQFRSYVDEIDNLGEQTFDIVLVDGRARVPCAIKALSYLKPNSVVLVHDAFRFSTPENKVSDYSAILSYYDTADSVSGDGRQGLLVLRRKPSLDHLEGDHKQVQNILNKKFSTAP